MSRAYILLSSLWFSSVLASTLEAYSENDYCGESPHPERVELKHIESKGIGYNQGYTSLEGFFPFLGKLEKNWVPFFDVRASVFNDGRPAVNAGVGFRCLNSRVWGANLYYDYRNTSRYHYNQIGIGLESLGKLWDFRFNGYFPVGRKESSSYQFRFKEFKGHRMILSSKRQVAMTGWNAELGAHAYHRRNIDLYAAFGPYYFNGKGRSAWGAEGRLAFTAWDHLRLQLSGSYDNVFKGIVQGEVGLSFSWGARKAIKKRASSDCCHSLMIIDRALQRVDRQEIIVVSHKHRKSKAINPATGKPYTFWFVNNTSHSQGTIKSPFNTLPAAESASGPNDVIYVFTGDGTDNGMNSGIILQQGQQLLGAGINQSISTTDGAITIPAQDTGFPLLTNTNDASGFGVQLVAGNNVISGLMLQDTLGIPVGSVYTGALTILNGSDYLIQNNQILTLGLGDGVNIYGPGNNTSIVNNNFYATTGFNFTTGILFYDKLAPVTGSFYIANNLFKGISDSTGFNDAIGTFGASQPLGLTSNVSVDIVFNTFVSQTNTATTGIAIDFVAENANLSIIGNYMDMSGITSPTAGVFLEQDSAAGLLTAFLDQNISITIPPVPGYDFVNDSGNPSAIQINFDPSNVGTRVGP